MSDLTDLLDNVGNLLQSLKNVEQAHNLGDRMEVETILYALDPVEIRAAQQDCRELSLRLKGVYELRHGTTGTHDGHQSHQSGAATSAGYDPPSVPETHPGFSVKVPCE